MDDREKRTAELKDKEERFDRLKGELIVARANCERKKERLQMFSRVKGGPQYSESPKERKEQEESLEKEVAECERECASLEQRIKQIKAEIDDETHELEDHYLS